MPATDLTMRVLSGTTYAVNPYQRTAVPTGFELHLMNRLGCGWSRSTWALMRRAGGASAWLDQQLDPGSITEDARVTDLPAWFPELEESPQRKWQRSESGERGGYEYARDLGCATMVRRIHSRRQVLETMVDFWSNHLHITGDGGPWWTVRADYDATIRRHALGRFEDMLLACTLHPAMVIYLDNFRSVRNAPNENHGRELLELHTVGRTSGYTEDMVKDSAVILSGYTVGYRTDFVRTYSTAQHTTGAVRVLGFSHANTAADGQPVTEAYLRYLARHPATARTIAHKMAVRFVSDTPPDALVEQLAQVYLSSGTDIKAMLRTLVASDAFRASAGRKVRTTVDDLVATTRSMQVKLQRPTRSDSFAVTMAYAHQGMQLYSWPRPDGAPERNADWASASRMLSSFRMHWNLAAGFYPTVDAVHRDPASWLPQRRIRLDQYVDHLSRMLLGRVSTARDLKGVCQATGFGPGELVTSTHPLARYMFIRMVSTLLDSPAHMSR